MLVSNFVTATENGLNVTLLIFICQLITDFFFLKVEATEDRHFSSQVAFVWGALLAVFSETHL